MHIVTLTTDFGSQDYYLALIKGGMLSENSRLNIVDVTHDIKNYDIVQAAFLFKNIWSSFPEGTIHLLSVNDFDSEKKNFLAIQHAGHYFIGPDNGIFSLVFQELPHPIFELEYPEGADFPLKELYAKAVGHIANGKAFNEIGRPVKDILQRISLQPVISPSQIRGSVIHVDNYENAVINITRGLFEKVGQGRPFSLFFKRHDPITKLCDHYYNVPVGDILCLFNSSHYLEIAVNMGKASSLLGLKVEDNVQINFHSPSTEK